MSNCECSFYEDGTVNPCRSCMERPTLNLKVKRLHPDAKLPTYAKPGDAAMDIACVDDGENTFLEGGSFYREYRTGLALEIPAGHVGYLFPRSSVSNTSLTLANCVGVVDSGFRGEVTFRFRIDAMPVIINPGQTSTVYRKGDRIGQLIIMPIPAVLVQEVSDLSTTERGTGGYGSTGA